MTLALAPAVVTVLGQSALRSLLLGAVVFTVLRLVRLRDLRAETAIWTGVLAAALAMPVLAAVLPGVPLRLPLVIPETLPGALQASVAAAPARHAGPSLGAIAAGVYLLGALVGLVRIVAGLAVAAILYLRAEPIDEPWARDRAIRASAAIDGPLSFARCILLPADYPAWPETKLIAVLAHEECHLRRGDFFIQLLASVHRALFWFSPFPWWLQRKLGELAETASDAAGARRIGDAASYAEILIDVTRAARSSRARARGVLAEGALAMAHGPGLARRVDHILAQTPERALGGAGRLTALAAVATAALALAGVHAAAMAEAKPSGPGATSPHARTVGPRAPAPSARRGARARSSTDSIAARADPPAGVTTAPRPVAGDEVSYDPLALLDDSATAAGVVPAVILTGSRIGAAFPKPD